MWRGFEANVLDGLELDRFRPRVLIVEDDQNDANLTTLLARSGYEKGERLAVNRVFFRSDLAKEFKRRLA